MHSRAIQCKQAAYTSILIKVGNGRHVNVRAWPRPSRSAWAENIANAWLPIQTYGVTSKGRNLILRRKSKFPGIKSLVSTHSACPCKNCPPKCSQTLHELDYLFKFAFFFYLVYNKSLRLIVKKECFDLALMWAITGVFFRGHFRSLITRA